MKTKRAVKSVAESKETKKTAMSEKMKMKRTQTSSSNIMMKLPPKLRFPAGKAV